eukprot:jgi/Orpsp1_1/1175908/evm.model.c7180000055694.1
MSLQYPIYKGEIKNNLKLKKNASIQVSGSTTYSIDDYNNSLDPKGDYIGFRNLDIQYVNNQTKSYPVTINVSNIENNTSKVYNTDDFDQYDDLIPIMNSNNQDGIKLSCSYYYNNDCQPYKAFDRNDNSYYSNYTQHGEQWYKIELNEPEIVNVLYIYNAGDNGIIYSLNVSGSNDDGNYDVLYTSESNLRNNIKYNLDLNNSTTYKFYKLNTN